MPCSFVEQSAREQGFDAFASRSLLMQFACGAAPNEENGEPVR